MRCKLVTTVRSQEKIIVPFSGLFSQNLRYMRIIIIIYRSGVWLWKIELITFSFPIQFNCQTKTTTRMTEDFSNYFNFSFEIIWEILKKIPEI